MSKLFKLKEWLTLDEAANHLSNVLGEPVTVADLYRLALDEHIKLSIDFVNHTYGKTGKWVKTEQIEFVLQEHNFFTGEKLETPYSYPSNHELHVSDDDWIYLDESIVCIKGVWDLTMVGSEKLDIEHWYQQLTSGLEVTLISIEGVFVQQKGIVCQLQTSFDDNEFHKGSTAHQKNVERHIITNEISDEEATKIREEFKKDRNEYLKKKDKNSKESDYYPSGGLAEHDHVLVIRTNEITRFIQTLEDTPLSEKPLTSKERNSLLVLIGALCEDAGIDPKTRGITASLVAMTELIGSPLTDDTIRKILNQIDAAVSLRSK